MKYVKYTFAIMMVTALFALFKVDAIGIGYLDVDPLGLAYTSEHQKLTSNPQYAKMTSCYGVLTGVDFAVDGRGIKTSDNGGVGDWIELYGYDRELTGSRMRTVNAKYKLNLKAKTLIENCRFVGEWKFN